MASLTGSTRGPGFCFARADCFVFVLAVRNANDCNIALHLGGHYCPSDLFDQTDHLAERIPYLHSFADIVQSTCSCTDSYPTLGC